MLFTNRKTGESVSVEFRPFAPGDEEGFRACIEDYYGGGYPYPEYFEPGYLAGKCAAGEMLVLCGVRSDTGEIVNTCAIRLDGEFPGTGLMLLRVVKPAYQGLGIGREQERIQLEYARALSAASLYADVMTQDCISQHGLEKSGFALTGLRPGLYDAAVMLPGFEWRPGARLSQAVMCRRWGLADAGELFCPAEHRAAAERIYGALGAAARFTDSAPGDMRAESVITEEYDARHRGRVLIVRSVGGDFAARLGAFGADDAAAVCYLNLKSPGAEKRAFSRWARLFARGAAVSYDPPLFIKLNSVITTAISLAGTVIMYYGAVKSGVTVADYYAFTGAYAMVSGAFSSLAGIALTAAQFKPIYELARPILETVPETGEDREIVTRLSGGIELSHVTFRYTETMPPVLDNLSLKIRPGQYVAIVGPTGCGKSTLLRLLLGFEKPQKGAVYYDGRDISRLDLKSLRRRGEAARAHARREDSHREPRHSARADYPALWGSALRCGRLVGAGVPARPCVAACGNVG